MNVAGENDTKAQVCPYLGQAEDADTAFYYPSKWNRCYHAKPIGSVNLDHQGEYCLTANHSQCGVYLRGRGAPLPAKLGRQHPGTARRSIPRKNWVPIYLLVIVAIVIFVAWLLLSQNVFGLGYGGIWGGVTPPAFPTDSRISTPSVSPTQPQWTLTPALVLVTETFIPPAETVHALEIPIGPEGLLIHWVANGESLESISRHYGTTVDAIKAVNFHLQSPLWADWVIVIPANRTDVGGLPSFETYQLTENITIEDLAGQLSAVEDSLKYYNAVGNGEIVTSGEWLIIPHMGTASPIVP